jgi:hypothetical protein
VEAIVRRRSRSDRFSDICVRDPDGSVRRHVDSYRERRGLTFSTAVRELIEKGIEATGADHVKLHALIPSLHMLISDLRDRVPASGEYNRLLMYFILENVALLRQVASTMKYDALKKAQDQAKESYQKMIKERTI